MPDNKLTVETPESQLKVGAQDANYIKFAIKANEPLEDLEVEIKISCGTAPDTAYLCADCKDPGLELTTDQPDEPGFDLQTGEPGLVSFTSAAFDLEARETVNITIKGFSPERGGEAEIQLKIANPATLHDQPYKVSIASAQGAAILSLKADATKILQDAEVTITSKTVGAKIVKLYADDKTEVKPVATDTTDTVTKNKYVYKPQEDTIFRLKAWQTKQTEEPVERQITVLVTPRSGWFSRDLLINSLGQNKDKHTYYPTLLLQAKDLSGETPGDKLYGIFVCKETGGAGLWSSSLGVADWRRIADVPDGVAGSPGVIHKQVLWLIGGSAVNPLASVSNRIWWFYKNQDTKQWVWAHSEGSAGKPPPRICHACVEFDGKVWVLGGLSEQNQALNDVWTCSADPVNNKFGVTWEGPTRLPQGKGRCLPVVTVTPKSTKGGEARLWLFGGATHPYNLDETFYDLWWTQDGKDWESRSLHEQGKGSGNETQVLAATIFYDDKDNFLHLAGIFRAPGKAASPALFALKDVDMKEGWGEDHIPGFGWSEPIELLLIRSVSFAERWIFSPLYQDPDRGGGYKARIYIP